MNEPIIVLSINTCIQGQSISMKRKPRPAAARNSNTAPGVLDNLGLAASIEWQAREFQKRLGIACTVAVPEQPLPLSSAQSTALFRIFQEILTNITRHAQARHVHAELTATSKDVILQVVDDGRGIQRAEVSGTRSLGLLGMRERAELLGGAFDIRAAQSKGTLVTVSIPFTQHA
jgi:signal transduction histidine kinase